MKKILAVSLVMIFGCLDRPQNSNPNNNIITDSEILSSWTGFPINKELLIKDFDTFHQEMVAEVLIISEELALISYNNDFSIRMIYSDSWTPDLMIRLEIKTDSSGKEYLALKSRVVDIHWENNMEGIKDTIRGEVLSIIDRKLIINDYFNLKDTILTKIEDCSLFQMSSLNDFKGNDGYGLYLELLIKGKYKAFYRWTPESSKSELDRSFLDFCKYIVSLQFIGIDKIGYN